MDLPARELMEFDVVVVGAGPAGLAAAIRLKQDAAAKGGEISVVVVEKGSEVGAHILSGAVIDPCGLDRVAAGMAAGPRPSAHTRRSPRTSFIYLGPAGGVRLPNLFMPKLMNNHGNFIGSLGNVARYLGRKAEELGVEIYPGFPAAEFLDEDGRIVGIATGDMGIGRDGEPQCELHPRHGAARQIHDLRRGRARQPDQADWSRRFDLANAAATIRNTASASRKSGRSIRRSTSPASCATPWAGRCPTMPAAAPGSIISTTTWCRSASWCISTTRTRPCRRSTSCSGSRPTR